MLNVVVVPDVRDDHLVLRQRAGLVGADDGRWAERFDCLKIFDEAILWGHPLGRQGEAHRYGGNQPLWNIGDQSPDEEDDGIQPMEAVDDGDDEEEGGNADWDPFDFSGGYILMQNYQNPKTQYDSALTHTTQTLKF